VSRDRLGFDVTQKATGAHPLDALRSHFGAVVYVGENKVRTFYQRKIREKRRAH
jgi:hypothetical protein